MELRGRPLLGCVSGCGGEDGWVRGSSGSNAALALNSGEPYSGKSVRYRSIDVLALLEVLLSSITSMKNRIVVSRIFVIYWNLLGKCDVLSGWRSGAFFLWAFFSLPTSIGVASCWSNSRLMSTSSSARQMRFRFPALATATQSMWYFFLSRPNCFCIIASGVLSVSGNRSSFSRRSLETTLVVLSSVMAFFSHVIV